MDNLNRRRFLAGALGIPMAAAVGTSASAAPATHSLWRLDPAWGYPLTTDSGSDTKSQCRASACHNAAPHRFFLTEADALAGRLHKCCLAQPVRVDVCADLNQLMPYYTARFGGIDARCPTLPDDLRTALQTSGACAVVATTTSEPAPTTTSEALASEAPQENAPSTTAGPGSSTTSTSVAVDSAAVAAGSGTLPVTGSSTSAVVGVGAVLAAAGAAAVVAARSHA